MDALQFTETLSQALKYTLEPRLCRILHMRMGMADGQHCTLAEIAVEIGVSRERIRQLERKAFRAFRRGCVRECRTDQDSAAAKLLVYVWLSLCIEDEYPVTRIRMFADTHLPTFDFDKHALPLLAYLIFKSSASAARFIEHAREVSLERRRYLKRKSQEERRRRRLERLRVRVRRRFEGLKGFIIRPTKSPDLARLATITPQRSVSETGSGISGEFHSDKLGRTVAFESNAERRVLEWLEFLDDVTWYCEQPFEIPYTCTQSNKTYRYFPDVMFVTVDGEAAVIEIKPVFDMALKRNLDKWSAARRYLADLGIGFLVTDGRVCVQQLMRHSVNSAYRRAVLDAVGTESLDWKQYEHVSSPYVPRITDFAALVLQEKLCWNRAPFRLGFQHPA